MYSNVFLRHIVLTDTYCPAYRISSLSRSKRVNDTKRSVRNCNTFRLNALQLIEILLYLYRMHKYVLPINVSNKHQFNVEFVFTVAPVKFFSKLNKIFVGYFDPKNNFLHDKNK